MEGAFRVFGIDYYLIGAFVRDVWTDHISALLDKNLDILEESDEVRFSGAKLLGREMAAITKSSRKLYQAVDDILEGQLENFSDEDIEEMYEANKSDEHILKLKMVKELLGEYKK